MTGRWIEVAVVAMMIVRGKCAVEGGLWASGRWRSVILVGFNLSCLLFSGLTITIAELSSIPNDVTCDCSSCHIYNEWISVFSLLQWYPVARRTIGRFTMAFSSFLPSPTPRVWSALQPQVSPFPRPLYCKALFHISFKTIIAIIVPRTPNTRPAQKALHHCNQI